MKRLFNVVAVILLLLHHNVSAVGSDEVSVMEGDSVTLNTGVQTNQQEDIIWYFSSIRIAQINGDLSSICTDVQCNEDTERFRDRLKLDHQTGSLTITNTRNTDSGLYKLKIFSSNNSEKIFSVSVTDSGVSSGAVAGIVVAVLLVFAAAAAASVVYYRHHKAHAAVPQSENDDM